MRGVFIGLKRIQIWSPNLESKFETFWFSYSGGTGRCHRPAHFSPLVWAENSAQTGPKQAQIGPNLVYRINTES
ncbi:unnamed protein product [Musa textilis]